MQKPILRLRDADLRFGDRLLWSGLDLDVNPGEFIAVLGANGTGKTSLLKVLLGQLHLYQGTATIAGENVRSGLSSVGYIPQQRGLSPSTPMRGRDLVGLGIYGHKWGPGWPTRKRARRIDELMEAVGATEFAKSPVGSLSGGELQRLRVAQAIANNPSLLLCDEPLLSLDLHHQARVSKLINDVRNKLQTAVLFVTHEINPIMPYVDRVLYLAQGRFLLGTPDEVINSEALSRLYGSTVQVVNIDGRVLIVGGDSYVEHTEPDEAEL